VPGVPSKKVNLHQHHYDIDTPSIAKTLNGARAPVSLIVFFFFEVSKFEF
jgi:hypothetical protein